MSYLEDIRGALAASSGASRRSQALRALGLPTDVEGTVQGYLDDAVSSLIEALALLKANGHDAPGSAGIARSAAAGWQARVYGGQKDNTAAEVWSERRAKPKSTKPRSYEQVFGEATPTASTPQVDLAHPWATEERQ